MCLQVSADVLLVDASFSSVAEGDDGGMACVLVVNMKVSGQVLAT